MKLSFLPALALAFSFIPPAVAADSTSFVPSNPPEMKRLTARDTPAHRAAKLFMHGINLGDYLEAAPGWSIAFSADELAIMRREGFDHVRVPVGWHRYTGDAPDFTLKPEIFAKVDFVVTNALANQLAVLINIHHFSAFDGNPSGQTDRLIAIWRQVAAHYAEFPNTLAFELLNEPHNAARTDVVNPIYPRVIAEIRKTNPRRTIFVEPGNWGHVDELKNLVLPAEDDNLIVSAHCYDPFYFTHQGARWAGADVKATGIRFPGPPPDPLVPDPALGLRDWVLDWIQRYNTLPTEQNPSSPAAFEGRLKFAREWSDHYGRPVHIGEFGCYVRVDGESRARFLTSFRKALDEQKLGWAMWDWSANFRYWDKGKNEPMPGVREALFGK